jgi:uncharacterized phage infection (PIP) family protein YhgE
MANSIYESTGDGSTTDFTIPYSYLEADDVTAFVDGVSTSFTFTSDNIVSFATAPSNGAAVRIVRNTDIASLNVTYSDGGALTAKQLNDSNTQLLYGVQEAIDTANEAITLDDDGKFDAQVSSTDRVIKNVADPTNAQDVATKNYVDTASTSQVNQATTQATNAANSATAAANSATASASSASAASTSETNAATSAATATTQATNSSNSATASANSATASATSATASANSATASATSATAAASSAADAQSSEDEAEEWATKTNGIVASTGYSAKAWATGGTGVTDTAGSGSAKEWATDTTNQVDGTEYSAKEYAIGIQRRGSSGGGSAKDWATYTAGTVDGTLYSAKYYAEQAAVHFDNFDDKYLGSKSSDPTVDNDGNALIDGALYYDTTSNNLKVYDLGTTTWIAITAGATAGFSIAMSVAL